MLTIKCTDYASPTDVVATTMTILTADRAEVLHSKAGTAVRLTWFGRDQTGVSETIIQMDRDSRYGPATIYIENEQGRTVQRVSSDTPYIPPTAIHEPVSVAA